MYIIRFNKEDIHIYLRYSQLPRYLPWIGNQPLVEKYVVLSLFPEVNLVVLEYNSPTAIWIISKNQ